MSFARQLQEAAAVRQAMRRVGYDDGYQGKPARYSHDQYQISWRRGREARAASERGDVA